MELIREIIKKRIDSGEYAAGQRLGSERGLAAEFSAPQSRVRKALRELVRTSYLHCRRNSGYYVNGWREEARGFHEVALCVPFRTGTTESRDSPTGILVHLASREKITLRPVVTGESPEAWENTLQQIMADQRLQGVLIHPGFCMEWSPAFARALAERYPLVFGDYSPFPGIFSSAGAHHFEIGFQGARLLAARGYRKPLYVGYIPDVGRSSALKLDGFRKGCQHFGIAPAEPLLILNTEFPRLDSRLRQRYKARAFDAVFATTRAFTLNVVGVVLQIGAPPGRDFALLGVDEPCPLPGLALQVDCILRDTEREAREALALLREQITQGGLAAPKSVLLPPRYLAGNTLREIRKPAYRENAKAGDE